MVEETLSIPGLDLPLAAKLRRPAPGGQGGAPVVITVHGFNGFMDWGHWPWLAGELASQGYACLRFNFSHNGIGPEPEVFTEFKRYENNTFTREVAELSAVIQAASVMPGLDPNRIILLGHSLGGAIALLAAGAAPAQVRGVITWASLAGLEALHGFAGKREAWLRDGFVEVTNGRTGQVMRLGAVLLEDWEAHRAELDVEAALGQLVKAGRPVTAIHGTQDAAVPWSHALRLQAGGAKLIQIDGADHTFGMKHPFLSTVPGHFQAAVAATMDALKGALEATP